MWVVPFLPSAVLLALVLPTQEEDRKGAGRATGNAIIGRGTVLEPSELVAFLQMSPEEAFDLESINMVDSHALLVEAREEKRLLLEVVRTVEALLPRVRAETEDPILVGAILRNKTLDWYRKSPSDVSWVEYMPIRWGGIFHESRVPGGRLSRKLSTRLVNLVNECVRAAGTATFLRAGFTGLFRGSANMAGKVQFALGSRRPRLTQQVAQAYLDDLAASARDGDQPLPLEHLSEVARRNGSAEVNITLSDLFRQDGPGSLTVIEHRFHPGMNTLVIRVMPPKNPDDASTYDLIPINRQRAHESGAQGDAAAEARPTSPWERQDMTKKDWLELFRSLEKRKAKLEPPPRENSRDRESYLGLRDLVLSDSSIRKPFLAVRWRGKPSGLPLLCQLLSDATWVPDVETDGDYLEAELDHLDKGHAARRPKEGEWQIGHGWTVVREFSAGNVRTYRATGKSAD